MCLKVEENEIGAERADQKRVNNLPLARQFALTAVRLQMFSHKTCHVWPPIRTRFFVSSSRLDVADGNFFFNAGFYSAQVSVIGNLNNIN